MCSGRRQAEPAPAARAEKRAASRFYQLKSGHALTGVYLKSTDNRPDDHCWWCDPENISGTQQTRDHPFKHCSRWKDQQAELWASQRGNQEGEAEVACRRPPGGGEVQLGGVDSLRCTYVGRAAPSPPVEESWHQEKGRSRWVRVHVQHARNALNDTSLSTQPYLSTQPCVYPRSLTYPRSGAHQRSAPYCNVWHDISSLSTQPYVATYFATPSVATDTSYSRTSPYTDNSQCNHSGRDISYSNFMWTDLYTKKENPKNPPEP